MTSGGADHQNVCASVLLSEILLLQYSVSYSWKFCPLERSNGPTTRYGNTWHEASTVLFLMLMSVEV